MVYYLHCHYHHQSSTAFNSPLLRTREDVKRSLWMLSSLLSSFLTRYFLEKVPILLLNKMLYVAFVTSTISPWKLRYLIKSLVRYETKSCHNPKLNYILSLSRNYFVIWLLKNSLAHEFYPSLDFGNGGLDDWQHL